jgi:upstream activation factor subunit UAF30
LLHVGILSMLSSMAFDGEMKEYSGVIFLTGGITIMATKKKPAKKPAAKKSAAKKAPKKAAKKVAPKKKSGAKRKPNAAFMKPMTPSAALAAVVGSSPMPRTEVTSKIWVYIKKHGLQDAKNKRMIVADDKLKAVFGGKKQVDMFEMTSLVSKNLK